MPTPNATRRSVKIAFLKPPQRRPSVCLELSLSRAKVAGLRVHLQPLRLDEGGDSSVFIAALFIAARHRRRMVGPHKLAPARCYFMEIAFADCCNQALISRSITDEIIPLLAEP